MAMYVCYWDTVICSGTDRLDFPEYSISLSSLSIRVRPRTRNGFGYWKSARDLCCFQEEFNGDRHLYSLYPWMGSIPAKCCNNHWPQNVGKLEQSLLVIMFIDWEGETYFWKVRASRLVTCHMEYSQFSSNTQNRESYTTLKGGVLSRNDKRKLENIIVLWIGKGTLNKSAWNMLNDKLRD